VILRFLLGRLAGYLLFALFAWSVSRPLLRLLGHESLITGFAYMILAILLVLFGFIHREHTCTTRGIVKVMGETSGGTSSVLPIFAGFVTGLSFCPPFLLATADAVHKGNLPGMLFFFLFFFIGTSLFFFPLPFLAFLRRLSVMRVVGRMAAGIMGLYYFYTGLIMVIGGFYKI
jgi:hypothetical protein